MSRVKIADFRKAINNLMWTRNDLHGATSDEFKRMNIPMLLEDNLTKLQALIPQVSARFAADIDKANEQVGYAQKMIANWEAIQSPSEAAQAPQTKPTLVAIPGGLH